MQINLSIQSPDRQRYKCLVLGLFCDEKPPRGICGLMDWRMNGMISREIKKGHLQGEFHEKAVIPWPDRVYTELLLLFGMGHLSDLSYNRIYDTAYEAAVTVDKMKIRDFAFDLPGEGRSVLSPAGVVEAIITGFFDHLSNDVSKLSNTTVCLMTSSGYLKEVAEGIKQFNKNVRHMGSVDFSALEPYLTSL